MDYTEAVRRFEAGYLVRRRKKTKLNYASLFRIYGRFLETRLPEQSFENPQTLEAFIYAHGTLAPRTRKQRYRALKCFFSYLVTWELIYKNPLKLLPCPKCPQKDNAVPTREQLNMLIEWLDEPYCDIAEIALTTGCRIGELIKNNSDVWYPPRLLPGECALRIYRGKTMEFATIPIPIKKNDGRALDIIMRHLDKKNRLVFGNISDARFRYQIIKTSNELGFHCPPHQLRHAFATYYYDDTHDLVGLQSILSHKDIATTRVYVRTDLERIRENMEKTTLLNEKGAECHYSAP